jgi:hypothetical protein
MKSKSTIRFLSALLFLTAGLAMSAPKEEVKTWTDPETALREDPDFAIQGEYGSPDVGVQVVALGKGQFEAYVFEGGLPGQGWVPGKKRSILRGLRHDGDVLFTAESKKSDANINGGKLGLNAEDGTKSLLPRIERNSPTLNAKPPEGAVVLFDGTSAEQWENGKMEDGLLLATGCTTKRVFGSYKLHLEFRTPYKPAARGQQRGNSGVYQSGRWETQILDSFGLEGEGNECGGIYSISKPKLNMCLPPLAWQTYDVDFVAASFDASGKRTAWPRITVRLNGVLVHEDLELSKDFTPSAPLSKPLDTAEGPIHLQAHGNAVAFRNIWIVPGS